MKKENSDIMWQGIIENLKRGWFEAVCPCCKNKIYLKNMEFRLTKGGKMAAENIIKDS